MDSPYKIVIVDFIHDALEPEREVFGDTASVEALNAFHEEELVGNIEDADAIMVYHNLGLSRMTIERLEKCKVIVRCGVGFDLVDHEFARQRGIPVANIPDYGSEEVADSAIGMMLAHSRGFHYLNSRLRAREGAWQYTQVTPLRRLCGRVFGIVGLGRIGSAVALRAKALGMEVVYFDPYKPDGYDKALGVRRAETLDALLAEAFVLSLHCPLTPETQHLVGADQIAQMPKGSYLINTARGGVVDVRAIPEALANGHLAGVGIDVLEQEPPDDSDPLLQAWRDPQHQAYHRLIINPHSSFYCEEGLLEMRVKGSKACRRALKGLPIPNIVN
ncbi:MAG: C-terminal binding protein [Planctomycetes bacterium]|nr:C-terminal binding protein [Planctomycetota bacterium]